MKGGEGLAGGGEGRCEVKSIVDQNPNKMPQCLLSF